MDSHKGNGALGVVLLFSPQVSHLSIHDRVWGVVRYVGYEPERLLTSAGRCVMTKRVRRI